MTLEQLQRRTLKFLRAVSHQLQKMPHEEGLNDTEFIEQVVNPFRNDIKADREMLKMIADQADRRHLEGN